MGAGLEDLFGQERPGEPDEAKGERRRAMVVAAHPDDADFGAAGTAALLAQAGWEVCYLVVTDGSKGSDDPAFDAARLVATREVEQRDAARILGVSEVRYLGYTDGELVYSRELLGRVTREIREYQPFAVYTHDPEPVIIRNAFVNHSDHRATGLVTVDAVYPTARDRLNFPEHLQPPEGDAAVQPHKVRELYLWGVNEPNFSVDITAVLETKIEALLAHGSQFPDPGFVDQMREFWKEPDGRSLEHFRRIVMFD
ncbi:MAG: PIG-L deacetylase family protein [Dehalococcoidia bacterium]